MGTAAYRAIISTPSQNPVLFIDEVATRVSPGLFRIDDYTKRVLDRNAHVLIKRDNGSVIHDPPGVVSSETMIDYFYGEITTTFFGAEPRLFVSASYLPLSPIIGANSYSVDIEGDVLDATDFEAAASNGGFNTRILGMTDVTLTIGTHYNISKFNKNKVLGREPVLIRIGIGSETIFGWFVLESANNSGDVGSIEAEELVFRLDGDLTPSFSWR